MSKPRRKRCPNCGFLDSVKNGKNHGHQRYYCKNCKSYFTTSRKDISHNNHFVWFERWILGKQTISQLSESSGYSEKSLRNWFSTYLRTTPQWPISRREKVHLLIDGTYFANKVCLVVYRDYTVKATLLYRLTAGEWETEIREDLLNLLEAGLDIESVTCDGLSNIIKAVKKTCKKIVIQRCLVHIQRECKIWLTKHPQSYAARDLRSIVCGISGIKSQDDKGYWVWMFNTWKETYNDYLQERSYSSTSDNYWYTHKMVRKSYVHIKRALPYMFHYLDNPQIPNNTNSLESFFGHLKQNISLHRGLSLAHYRNYVKWYLYFRDRDNKK